MSKSKTMIFPKAFQDEINNTMRKDGFPFDNMTHFVIIASLSFEQGFNDACKNDVDRDIFVSEIIKVTKHLRKTGMIAGKLYGWKEGFRERV